MASQRLLLIRHAKTEQEPPQPEAGDDGRELTDRGRADAQAAGRWLTQEGLRPDLVLCSTSIRTRQTWEAMVAGAEQLIDVEVWPDRRIYEAGTEDLRAALADAPAGVRTLALVGHAPGVPDLVADLVDPGQAEGEAAETLAEGFPTMTCAVLEIAQEGWHGIPTQSARLGTVHTARRDP